MSYNLVEEKRLWWQDDPDERICEKCGEPLSKTEFILCVDCASQKGGGNDPETESEE